MRTVLLMLTLVPGIAAAGEREDHDAGRSDVRKTLQALYDRAGASARRKDMSEFFRQTTPDFSMKMTNGQTYEREKIEPWLKQQVAMLKTVTAFSMKIQKLALTSDKAVSTIKGSFSGDLIMPDGKTHKLVNAGAYKDVWVRQNGGWLCKYTEVLSEKTTLDGKAFKLPVPTSASPKEKSSEK